VKYRNSGNSGVKVSVIEIETKRIASEKTPEIGVNGIIDHALELGINHIDTANANKN